MRGCLLRCHSAQLASSNRAREAAVVPHLIRENFVAHGAHRLGREELEWLGDGNRRNSSIFKTDLGHGVPWRHGVVCQMPRRVKRRLEIARRCLWTLWWQLERRLSHGCYADTANGHGALDSYCGHCFFCEGYRIGGRWERKDKLLVDYLLVNCRFCRCCPLWVRQSSSICELLYQLPVHHSY
jgi:hypothetical protein